MRNQDETHTKDRGHCCVCLPPGPCGGCKAAFLSIMRSLSDFILLWVIYFCCCCCFFPYVDEQLPYDEELGAKNKEIKKLKEKVDALVREEADESVPLVPGTKDSSHIGRVKSQLHESERENRHQQKRIEKLEKEITELRRQRAAKNETSLLETSRSTTSSRRHDRQLVSASQQTSLEEVNKMEEEIRKLSSDLEQTKQQLNKAREKERKTRAMMQKEIDSVREQMDQSVVSTENTEVLKMTEEIQELKKFIKTQDSKIRDQEQKLMAANRETYELQAELNEALTQSISGSSPQKIAELENTVSTYKEENERLRTEKNGHTDKVDQLSQHIVQLQDENETLMTQNSKQKTKINQLDQIIAMLQDQVEAQQMQQPKQRKVTESEELVNLRIENEKNRDIISKQAAQIADREREIEEMKEASNPTQSNYETASLHRQLDELRGRLQANKYGSGKFKGPPETKAFIEGMIATEVTDALDELEDSGCEPEVAQEVVFRTISAYYHFLQQQRDRVFENVQRSDPLLNNCIASQLGDAVWPYVQDAFVARREVINDGEFLQEFFTEDGIEGIERMGDEYRELYFAEEPQKNAMQSYVEACGKLCFYIVWSKGNRMTLEPTGNVLVQEKYSKQHFALMFGGKVADGAPVNVVFPALYLPDDERESAFFPGAVIES